MKQEINQPEKISLEERIEKAIEKRDALEIKQEENGKIFRKLKEREKNGENVVEEIKKIREGIEETEHDLDGAYKLVSRLKKDLSIQGPTQTVEQKNNPEKEIGKEAIEIKNKDKEEKRSEQSNMEAPNEGEKKKFKESLFEAQKRVAWEIGQTLSLLKNREDNNFSTSIVPKEELINLTKMKSSLESNNLSVNNISEILENMDKVFRLPSVPKSKQVIEDSKSLENLIISLSKIINTVENYKNIITQGQEKNPEYKPLVEKTNHLKDAVGAKKIGVTILRKILGNYTSR